MKKSRKLLATTLSLLSLVSVGAMTLAGCGGGNANNSQQSQVEKFKLEWTVPEHAKVVVEGFDSLPTEVEADSVVSFTIQVDQGYAIDSVKSNNKKVSLKNEKYTIGVTRDTTIVIEVSEAISDLKVTTMPTKLTYIAGEEIDLTGMVVQVSLGTGGTQTIAYGADGYSVYPTVFEGGESEFEITYKKATIKVQLAQVVQYLVKIDANGGSFTPEYLANLQGRNLNNFKHENGVITFTYYNNLSSSVPMPKASDVERENFSLTGWSYEDASISNNTASNVDAKASWQFQIVVLNSLHLIEEGGVPYLVIKGQFKAADEVYLYLYEGNAKVELKGDTYTGTSGQDLEVKFDLTRLSEKGADYEGKWMDIRFNAKYDGKEESMEIFVNSSSTIEVETSEKLLVNSVAYVFATYNDALKVYFQNVSSTYQFEAHTSVVEGVTKDFLRISGHVGNAEHFNKYVHISAYNGSGETQGYGANIDGSGNFAVEYPLEEFSSIIKTNIFFHIGIYEDSTMANNLWGGTNTNVPVATMFTPMPRLPKKLGDITNAAKYVGSDGLSYYIGYAWDGLMLYVLDEGHEINPLMAKVENRNGVVYYVLSGTCTGFTSEDFIYGFYFQHINNLDGLGEADVYDGVNELAHATVDQAGNFEMVCPVSTLIAPAFKASSDAKWGMIAKYYVGDKLDEKDRIEVRAEQFSEETVTLDGVKYSVYANSSSTWNIDCLVLEKVS